MTAEEWRPIPSAPDYQVSNLGRVASAARGRRVVLRPWENANGYLYVSLGRSLRRTVHSLVAEAFVGPRGPGQVVRHLDGSRQNNVPANLAIGSVSENSYDAVRHGTHAMVARTHCPREHPYSPENTRMYKGRRFCKTCARDVQKFERRRADGLLLIVGEDPLAPCRHGHERTPANTYVSSGRRFCRPCARQRRREFDQRQRLRAAGVPTRSAA